MFNLHLFEGKTVRSFDQRGDQVCIYFTDESFLIITAHPNTGAWKLAATAELDFSGRALDNEVD